MNFVYKDYSHSIVVGTDLANTFTSRIKGFLDKRNEHQIRRDILSSIDLDTKRIIFDLSKLEYLSSSGIDLFGKILLKMKDTHHGVILYGINDSVFDILIMYGYQDRFRNFYSFKEAEEYASELDLRGPNLFDPFNIRCLKCTTRINIPGPGLIKCTSCGVKHSIALNGEVSCEDVTTEGTRAEAPVKSYRIGIFGERELVDLLKQGKFHHTHCISIGNPGQEIPIEITNNYISVLRLEFYDVDSVDDLMLEQVKRIPEPADVVKVINFFKSTNDKATGFDIHCWQGVSRSTAIGLGLLKLMGFKEEILQSILQSNRPIASPHKRLVQFFDKELGSDLFKIAESIHQRKIDAMRKELEVLTR